MRRLAVPVAMAVALSGCSVFGGTGDGYELVAYFPRAVALYEASDVRILGLVAGTVADVEVQGSKVKVTMQVDDGVPVPPDVHATIVPQSLIGERYVQLFPAWTHGDPRAEPGTVIPLERTSVPVEPDEALAALKEFLDSLDPDATGRLVRNLADGLEGAGTDLGRALEGVAGLVDTVAQKDAEIARIIEQLDDFTATLTTRESQLGRVLDSFAQLTGLLAQERREVERIVRGLGRFSTDALDLVSEHAARLERDIAVLTRTLLSVDANLDAVRQVLDATPVLVGGLREAHSAEFHRIDLRTQYSPLAQQAVLQVFGPLGIPVGDVVCLPADVDCAPDAPGDPQPPAPAGPAGPAPAGPAPAGPAPAGPGPPAAGGRPGPVDAFLDLLDGGTGVPVAHAPHRLAGRSLASRIGGGLRDVARSARGAAGELLAVAG